MRQLMVRLVGQPVTVSLVVLVALVAVVVLVMLTVRVMVGLLLARVVPVTKRAVLVPVMPMLRVLSLGVGGVMYPGRTVGPGLWWWS